MRDGFFQFERILLIGDLHGDGERLRKILAEYQATERDLLIALGDFGLVMRNTYREDRFLDAFSEEFGCTVAFVLGNHEHYPAIMAYETVEWYSGYAKKLRKNLFAMLSGEVYTFPTVSGEKRFFAFGGAASTDRGINPMRYATRFLTVDTDAGKMALTRRDAYDYQKRINGYRKITDRAACYRLTREIGTRLGACLSGVLPEVFKSLAAVLSQDEDGVRQSLAKMIAKTVGEVYRKEVRAALSDFYPALSELFLSLGYPEGKLAFVLEEGTWFKEELPSSADFKNATENLKRHGNRVDYIVTHTLPREMIYRYGRTPYPDDAELCGFLEWVMYETEFTHHFCGHFHDDCRVGDKHTIVYEKVHTV